MIRVVAGFLVLLASVGLAQPYTSINGTFTVTEIRGCDPLTITIKVKPDRPDGTCSFFAYRPFSTSSDTRNGPAGFSCSIDLTYDVSITQPEKFKLQVFTGGVGSGNLDEIEITVDPNIKPGFSISSCNNAKVQVLITDKTYDQYFIDFNAPSGVTTPLPSGNNPTADFTYTSTGLKNISVRGKKLNGAANCDVQQKSFTAVTNLPDATIQLLSVKDASTLELDYTPVQNVQYRADLSINNFTTFQTLKNPFFDVTAPQKESFNGLKTNENFYCLRLRKYDPCANTSEVINSTPVICSIETVLTAESKKNKLSWTQGPSIVTDYTVKRNDNLSFLTTTNTNLEDTNVICKTEYCYQVTANYPGNAKSRSPEKCIRAFSTEIPDVLTDIASAVEGNIVALTWPEPENFTASSYSIRRASGNLNFQTIDEIATPTYTDNGYDGEKPTLYQITYSDVCDNKSPSSVITQPIHLAGKVNNDNSIRMEWNAYRAYADGVSGYQVTKFDPNNNILQNFTVADTFLLDNTPDPSNQRVRYRITALPENATLEKSLSNTAEFTRQARLVFPTAFTPDGKGPAENETFRVFGEYISGIQLQIFDRWGKLLFTTNDLNKPWDGKSEGEDLPQSSYVWRAEITDLLGKTFTRTGSVALLRN